MNWQYISGFFDADGYITMAKQHKNENETPTLGITNTNLRLLEQMRNFILGEIDVKGVICTKTSTNPNHATSYDLRYVGFNKISKLKLESIHEKKQTRLYYLSEIKANTPRNGKYSESTLAKRLELVQKFLNTK